MLGQSAGRPRRVRSTAPRPRREGIVRLRLRDVARSRGVVRMSPRPCDTRCPPAVECRDERTDDRSVGVDRNQHRGVVRVDHAPEIVRSVSGARMRSGALPQLQNCVYVGCARLTDCQSHDYTGRTPCLRHGRSTSFDAVMRRPRAIAARVSAGSMTSSSWACPAAM